MLSDSSAFQSARETIGGCGTVDGGAGGSVGDGEAVGVVGDADGVGGSVLGVGLGGAGVSVVGVGDGSSVGSSTGSSEGGVTGGSSLGVGSSEGVSSTLNAAGSAASGVVSPPGSTVSSRSPSGSPARAPSPARTRTSTPSEGPTQRGSVVPRTPDRPVSVRPSISVSRGSQPVQSPVAADLVRASTLPVTRAAGSVQVTPSRLNGSVSRRASDAESPSGEVFRAVLCTSGLTGADLASAARPSRSGPELSVTPWNTRTPATAAVVTAAVVHILRCALTCDSPGTTLTERQGIPAGQSLTGGTTSPSARPVGATRDMLRAPVFHAVVPDPAPPCPGPAGNVRTSRRPGDRLPARVR